MAGKKLVVIGGGAAGLFCAINAARLNTALQVTLVEKTGKLLSKVKVSGGGRCNVTHQCFDIVEMSKKYPRGGNFIKKTFHQFFTIDTINWFEERGVRLKAEDDGRMFPVTDSSQTIIDCLLKEAARYHVEILMHSDVRSVLKDDDQFRVVLANESLLVADYVCIASGGYHKTSMFDWLKTTGHTIEEPVPSLFTFNMPGHPITKLMGVSVEQARIKLAGTKFEQEGPLLITHWGLSGPAVLKLSAWGARQLAAGNWQFTAIVNWLPDYNEQTLSTKMQSLRTTSAAQKIGNKNPFGVPQRLWEFLLNGASVSMDKRWADLSTKEQNAMVRDLCSYNCVVKGKTTFKEEFVTAGGIQLSEIDHNTMMSKKMRGLFFAGEVLDVDGITGGFNFQHAWTSAFIAGKAIASVK